MSTLDDPADLPNVLVQLKQAFAAAPYPSAKERRDRIARLSWAVYGARDRFVKALDADFGGRAEGDSLMADLWPSLRACRYNHHNVAKWMRPRRRRVGLLLQHGRAWISPQPLGVVAIVSPWNFPLFLSVAPLAAALAAGNRAVLKPSEFTPRTTQLLAEIISQAFSPDEVAVAHGGAEMAQAVVRLPFDHVLFTGSTERGRQVMASAAANLTPVTLELGGKCPALIAGGARLPRAARSIAAGKLLNAGQACVAPDYALVPRDQVDGFVSAYLHAVRDFYPAWADNPRYTAIVNSGHEARLGALLDDAERGGARIVSLDGDSSRRFDQTGRMAPCLVLDAAPDAAILQQEIFGPILPVIPYASMEEAIAFIAARPRPLALYLFSHDRSAADRILRGTHSGALIFNDTVLHSIIEDLPFGGVGASGMGRYHGREGFDAFSNLKSVFDRRWPQPSAPLRPPSGLAALFAKPLLRLAAIRHRK